MSDPRALETRVAKLTLIGLAIFAPVETYASWQMLGGAVGLLHPSYLVTCIGMVLMYVGARTSFRGRPRCAPTLMCVAYAWIVSYGLRSAMWRTGAVRQRIELHFGILELWATAAAATAGLAIFCVSLWLALRATGGTDYPESLRTVERRLAIFALGALVIWAPIEAGR